MAKEKELYWFRFEPKKYMNGNIQYCSYASQGLYINILSFYFMRECEMTKDELYRKYNRDTEILDELIKENVIKVVEGKVIIQFIYDQYTELKVLSEKLSVSGAKGAHIAHENRLKKMNQISPKIDFENTSPVIVEQRSHKIMTDHFYIGMKLHSYAISKYIDEECEITLSKFMPSVSPITKEQIIKRMEEEYTGLTFDDHNHVCNSFKKIGRTMLAKLTVKNNTDQKATITKRPDTSK